MADSPARENLTAIINAVAGGDAAAAEQLLPLVYADLKRLALARMARLAPGQTLQPTALVHEAYLRLIEQGDPGWDGRGHFFGAAARAMKNILVDRARRQAAVKHGGGRAREPLEAVDLVLATPPEDLLSLNEALAELERADPRKAEIVMLRYFAGLSQAETAAALQVSERTVEREWSFARAWLRRRMESGVKSTATHTHSAETGPRR